MLDISGVAHLFEGEAALIEDCRARLAAQGVTVLIGVAGNPRAASALARFSYVKTAPEPIGDKAFASFFMTSRSPPLASTRRRLRTWRGWLEAHRRHCAPAARADHGAVRRCSDGAARRAQRPRALVDRAALPAPNFCAERRFASPIQTIEAIEVRCASLPTILSSCWSGRPKARGGSNSASIGSMARASYLFGAFGRSMKRAPSCGSSPSGSRARTKRDRRRLWRRFMRLACLVAEPLAPSEAELERAHEAGRALVLAELLDRLSARLGARAVTRRELVDAHLPEQAEAARRRCLGRRVGLREERSAAPPPSLWGRTEEGCTLSHARSQRWRIDNLLRRATPHPCRPHRWGEGANVIDYTEGLRLGQGRLRREEPAARAASAPRGRYVSLLVLSQSRP